MFSGLSTETEAHEWLAVTRGRARRAGSGGASTGRGHVGGVAALLDQVSTTWRADVADQIRATLRDLFAHVVDRRLIARSPVPASQGAGST